MTIRKFIKKLFVTIIMIGIVLAAVLKVGYILICKVIVMIIFAVLAIRYWVGEDIRKAEEEKRGTWLFTLGFIGLTVLTMLAANIPGQVQRDQYLYLTKEHTEQLEKVLLREATADSERCIQWYEKQMLGIRNNKALGNPAMQTEDERRYKNRIDGKEVYRDPDTCTLRVKELKDGSTKDSVLINGPVGEIIAMRERIFYIDMEDHNVLKSVTYDGRKRKTWTKDPVKQFAVIGGYVICCTEDEKLIRCDMSTGKRKELADHIQYFFAGVKLYAQKGSKIVSVSYDGKEVRVFKKDVVMMDKKEDKVYYRRMDQKKEQMYVCDVDGGILHSAYMCYEDTAVLFSAPSETGKSTQAGLWEKYRGTWTVNGDRSLLIREEDGWYANGWPVCGSSEICNNKSYPVRAIVMLSQAKENRISRLKGLEALRKVMEQITINAWNSEFQIQAMDELEILLKEVPVYHLECDISEDAVRCLEDVLADGRGEE